jgi:hypothetical protein
VGPYGNLPILGCYRYTIDWIKTMKIMMIMMKNEDEEKRSMF